MAITISPLPRRVVAVILLLVPLALLWGVVITPALDSWKKASLNSAQASRLLLAYQNALREEPQWKVIQQELQNDLNAHVFIEGDDPDLAAARFQSEIKSALESAHGAIRSIQILPPTEDHNIRQINARVDVSVPMRELPGVLNQLEKHIPYVFVDRISISAPENYLQINAPISPLSVTCDFHAYMLAEQP